MIIFNIVFNEKKRREEKERRNFCSIKYWLDVLINSYSSTLSFNQVDLQNMMDPEREKRSHQSKFVKQFCYYTIVLTLQISLTAVTLAMTPVGENITLVNTVGGTYTFTPSHVFITLGVGWAAFVLALIFNLLYYILHPSQVNIKSFKEKRVITVFGYEIHLMVCSARKKGNEEDEADEEVGLLEMRDLQ